MVLEQPKFLTGCTFKKWIKKEIPLCKSLDFDQWKRWSTCEGVLEYKYITLNPHHHNILQGRVYEELEAQEIYSYRTKVSGKDYQRILSTDASGSEIRAYSTWTWGLISKPESCVNITTSQPHTTRFWTHNARAYQGSLDFVFSK